MSDGIYAFSLGRHTAFHVNKEKWAPFCIHCLSSNSQLKPLDPRDLMEAVASSSLKEQADALGFSEEVAGNFLRRAGFAEDLKRLRDSVARYPAVELWDYERNIVAPEDVPPTSRLTYHWICRRHSGDVQRFLETALNLTMDEMGTDYPCPHCSGRRLLAGLNDLATACPSLAAQWSERNETGPREVLAHRGGTYWWTCGREGHPDYRMALKKRREGRGCPVCGGKVAIAGFNDVASMHPHLLREWSPKNKGELRDYLPFSNATALWVCSNCGHEWDAPIANRTRGHGCGVCARRGPSREELSFVSAVLHLLPAGARMLQNHRGLLPGKRELDLYLPDYALAFEYNGLRWHDREGYLRDIRRGASESRERQKEIHCERLGVTLHHVWADEWKADPESYLRQHVKPLLEARAPQIGVHDL